MPTRLPRLILALALAAFAGAIAAADAPLTAAQDLARLAGLLHITALRPAADARSQQPPTAPNYDEAAATPFPDLPDALIFASGRPVRTAAEWRRRRAQITADFDREVYGRVPAGLPPVHWQVESLFAGEESGIPVVRKLLHGTVSQRGNPASPVTIQAALTTPAGHPTRVPVILELGFIGPNPYAPKLKDGEKGWQQQVLERGWGYAILDPRSVQADNGQGLTQGIVGLSLHGAPRAVADWGALRAWAWGASRVLDYLQADRSVDARRVAIEGLSRYGKAALVAMAYDERFAVALVGSSGAGGAKLHRRDFGERVENLAAVNQYHWMAGNYLKYAGPLNAAALPVDAHELIALCAPRPVFIGSGAPEVEGGWIDSRGMFLAAVAAGPVYRLLGRSGLQSSEYPPLQVTLAAGDVAFRAHEGGHTAGPNWPYYLDFAARYF